MPIPKLDAGAQKYNQKPGFSQLCHIHSPEQMIFDLFYKFHLKPHSDTARSTLHVALHVSD